MAITNLNHFLKAYFIGHDCKILASQNGILNVQLTESMDRLLMNRPFYWHYIKSIGRQGEPMQLTFVTNPEKKNEKGEWIHFGSPRLQQILNHLKTNEKYTKLFQQVTTNVRTALHPWLVTNIKVSYKGKQKKDELFSIGLNLITGMMKVNMMDYLSQLSLHTTIADYCYTISPMIKIRSGYLRIESVILNYLENQSHDWAQESLKTLEEDMETLKHFYPEDAADETMERELNEMKERYHPTITLEVINGGIFFLDTVKE